MPGQEKIHKVLREFKNRTLKSSSGQRVTDRKQAIAIAMSEAGQSKSKKPNHKLRAAKKKFMQAISRRSA